MPTSRTRTERTKAAPITTAPPAEPQKVQVSTAVTAIEFVVETSVPLSDTHSYAIAVQLTESEAAGGNIEVTTYTDGPGTPQDHDVGGFNFDARFLPALAATFTALAEEFEKRQLAALMGPRHRERALPAVNT